MNLNNMSNKEYNGLEDSIISDIFNICKIYFDKINNTDSSYFELKTKDVAYVNQLYNFLFEKINEHKKLEETNEIYVYENNYKIENDEYYCLEINSNILLSKSLISLFVEVIKNIKEANNPDIDWNIGKKNIKNI